VVTDAELVKSGREVDSPEKRDIGGQSRVCHQPGYSLISESGVHAAVTVMLELDALKR
jgi:hypothetical protein